MNIAYIFWGSIHWDNKELIFDSKISKANIKIPLNFSRISDYDKGKITLVIDQNNGTKCNVWYAKTSITNLNIAINVLKNREKTIKNNIAYININKKTYRNTNLTNEQLDMIYKYFKKKNFDAVVWTDISSNWEKIRGVKFSKKDAIKYIEENKKNKILYNKIIDYIINSYKYGGINLPITKYVFKIK